MNYFSHNKKLPVYTHEELVVEGDSNYISKDGSRLFLYRHPITGLYQGVGEKELDDLRSDFATFLKKYLLDQMDLGAPRPERIRIISDCLFSLLRKSPPPHPWLNLPADSREGRNSSTMANHAILVSAFSCALVNAWTRSGKPIGHLLRYQTSIKDEEIRVSGEELISFVRTASLCHDFGKHPPQKHNERGREQVWDIFSGILEEKMVLDLSDVAYRHHTSRYYESRGELPIGDLEELIAHADTLASAVDRPTGDFERDNPVSSVTRFLQEKLGDEKALSLISADTDRVKSYVFETARLPEIRGASAILTELNESKIADLLWNDFQLPPECLLYAAGGSALIVAPTAVAKELAESLQRLYVTWTKVANISVVHRPTSPPEWVRGVGTGGQTFGHLVRWLGYDLRRSKESRAFYPASDSPPYSKRCDSCEVRPAEKSEREPDGGEVFLCGVCQEKLNIGRTQKTVYLRIFEKEILEKEILQPESKKRAARDLKEISSSAKGKARGYVGVIYSDGNDIGTRLGQAQTPAEFRTLSEELRRVTREATFKALEKWTLPQEGEDFYPLEIIAIGGDDVFLIVPGDVALDVALELCENFQNEFNGRLTMSAGVLIMRDHLPIYYARSIVEALLKSAKRAGRKAWRGEGPIPAHIDFQVITGDSSLSEGLEEYRYQVYHLPSIFKGNHWPLQRPYPLEKLRELLTVARWVKEKGFPASQLYQLRQAIVEHVPAWAKNWYRYQLARDQNEKDNGIRQFHQMLFRSEWREDADAPWYRLGSEWKTPVIDLVEIFDYVRPRQSAPQ